MSGHPAGAAAPGLVCAFAVTRTPPDAAALAATTGHEEGGPLRVLHTDGLCLLVQDVPAALFGDAALAERLGRPDELERCARAHHRGVEAAGGRGRSVVPLPLATLYHDDRSARRAITDRATDLGALLDRLQDRTEWAVKVHAAEPAAQDGAGTGAEGGSGADGRAYLSRASARRRDRQDVHAKALAEAEAVDAELRRCAVAATRHRPQSERLTGRRSPQLLNCAYLVEDAEGPAFARALARLTRDRPYPAVEISASGPWIPYSFARWDQEPDRTRREHAEQGAGS